MNAPGLVVEHFAVGALQCTCTIVADTARGEALVIDGGDEAPAIAARLDALGCRATYLLHTHAHADHIGALGDLRERSGGAALLHPGDRPLYALVREQARWLGLPEPFPVALDGDLADGDNFPLGAASLEVLHTPGHTPGSVSFALVHGTQTVLLTGDTLFAGSIGRWDIGGTSMHDIVTSIRSKLLGFPDETVVVPGHGPATTIGIERASNPYLQAGAV